MNKFRTLKANEIECRIAQIKSNGLVLLLYKDARVDQNLLDETVGPLNWQRKQEVIDGSLYCTVSIWDDEKKQWISKQDVGTESFTEKEKGRASDAYKRSCFNWGIGRELYTAPFIWIKSDDCNIKEEKGTYKCYDNFEVIDIGYNDNREINLLEIVNTKKDNKVVFSMGKKKPATKKTETKTETKVETKPVVEPTNTSGTDTSDYSALDIKGIENEQIDVAKVNYLYKELKERDITSDFICNLYKVKSIETMLNKHFMHIINNWDEIKKRYDKV